MELAVLTKGCFFSRIQIEPSQACLPRSKSNGKYALEKAYSPGKEGLAPSLVCLERFCMHLKLENISPVQSFLIYKKSFLSLLLHAAPSKFWFSRISPIIFQTGKLVHLHSLPKEIYLDYVAGAIPWQVCKSSM